MTIGKGLIMYKMIIYLKSGKIIEFSNDIESFEKLAHSIYKQYVDLKDGMLSFDDKNNGHKYKIPTNNIDYIETINHV